jgi:SAM-dependent methyltransferase
MTTSEPSDRFAGAVAAHYDDQVDPMVDGSPIEAAVDVLAALAGGGRALELAIGTGRVALPLAARGVDVAGIELSPDMVARLRLKAGGSGLGVTVGDMTTARVPGEFSLVYLVFNTIENLTTQSDQVACFRNAAVHLAPGGSFLVEVVVPDLRRLPPGERFVVFDLDAEHWGIDEYEVATQGLVSHHLGLRDGQLVRSSTPFRYVWPAELDLMAELAGLRLRDRWSTWRRDPFTSESRQHVSVWEKRG